MKKMLQTIREYGVRDEWVLAAMAEVDRKLFVPIEYKHLAYEDRPLPIGYGQTVSQPYTVARMIELLMTSTPPIKQTVLEIGTGCGYQTAILAKLFKKVYSVDIVSGLIEMAKENLAKLKVKNAKLKVGDGKEGWREYAPYDGIIVAAMADEVPGELVNQLINGGRIVIPVGGEMMRGIKGSKGVKWEKRGYYSFVPLV